MNNKSIQAVILAAGESSRFWPLNSKHKSLLKIMGKPLIWYTIDGLRKVGVEDIIIVQGLKRDIEEELKNFPEIKKISYVIQPEANGMSGAMIAVKSRIKGQFFVVFAHSVDCQGVAEKMLEKSRRTGAKTVLVGRETKDPWLYGVARLEGDKLLEVIEKPEQGKEPSNIKINGIYLLDNRYFDYLEKIIGTVHFNKEFEAAVSAYVKENDSRIVKLARDYEGISLKYPWHLFKVRKYLFDNFLTKKTIARSAWVAKTAIIEGNVFIGENVKIYEGAVIKGPCYIGENSVVGNNSIVRDYCNLESGTMVGALCEVGRTIFQPDVHVHSGYFGDSILDRGVRVGAGAITANVRLDRESISARVKKERDGVKVLAKVDTGLKSLGTIIGENSKIGARATILPSRFIGKNCQINAGSIISRNIDDGQKI
jgi:bifunctional UDP-N-acetylglucosamine pyrophosphorylase/glucosamine-1-phosphate N-acetyltransferase